MERIVRRTLSGYRLNLPPDFKLFVLARDGARHELKDGYFGVEYWMRIPAHQILEDYNGKENPPQDH